MACLHRCRALRYLSRPVIRYDTHWRRPTMKPALALGALALAFSIGAKAADFVGYVIDEACSSKPAMKGNEACARKCIKGGSPAGLLTPEAKVYKLDDQAKVS